MTVVTAIPDTEGFVYEPTPALPIVKGGSYKALCFRLPF